MIMRWTRSEGTAAQLQKRGAVRTKSRGRDCRPSAVASELVSDADVQAVGVYVDTSGGLGFAQVK